ncbi:unnamed protein product [Allacma fusca]|uniref:Uncharacterized protein n=1 Tax=Allacma fusca TaxID=39272 RepID=A0A8J2K457_9HEXA|nr:unnamed protein product [Allacma fusca]
MFKHRLKHCRLFKTSKDRSHTKQVQTESKSCFKLLQSSSNDWTTAGLNIFGSSDSNNMRRIPLQDCINRIHIGDMELAGANADKMGIRNQFQTIDEVQNMIRHLQKLEEDMMKNTGDANGTVDICKSLEDLAMLDEREYRKIDDNETEWLMKVPGAKKISAKELESDESFIDSGLLNVRHGLLNYIKSALIEEKSAKLTNSPRFNNGYNTITLSQYPKKKSPPLNTTVSVSSASPPNLFHGFSPRHTAGVPLITATVPSVETSPVSSAVTNRSSFEFLSPGYHSAANVEKQISDTNNLYFSTPSGKQIDSRTYTRPKKNRLPLETYSDHHDLPLSPIRVVQPEVPVSHPQPETLEVETNFQNMNMNETFVATEDMEAQRITNEMSPPRRVTRNLSTFTRTREGTYSPSPTGSSNSIHTSSMEELHNLARLQEQTLRMSSNPKMLTRKETHTIVRVHDQPTLRPVNKPTTESQIPGQPKMRIQSRIPAPGAGSRIRPPMNGTITRRPITSGGIRRAPEWQDEGAY